MLPSSTRARLRMAMVVGAILVVGWLVWEAREALYPFIVGVILAFVLAPIVDRVVMFMPFRESRPGLALGLAVGWVYAVFILTMVLVGIQLVPRMGDQAGELADDVPSLVQTARQQFERGSSWYRERVPVAVQRQVDRSTQNLAQRAA